MKISNLKSQISNKYQFGIGNWKLEIGNSQLGFTLIELLIVVTIIGILSSLLTANFITVRQRSRDAQRKADLRQIQSALEIYRADKSSYPSSTSNKLNTVDCATSSALSDGSNTYMQSIPCDPSGISYYNTGNYYYNVTNSVYTLGACLENSDDAQGTSTPPDNSNISGCTSGFYYVLKSP